MIYHHQFSLEMRSRRGLLFPTRIPPRIRPHHPLYRHRIRKVGQEFKALRVRTVQFPKFSRIFISGVCSAFLHEGG